VIPEITGRAWMMGQGTLYLDPADPFPGGFPLSARGAPAGAGGGGPIR